MQAKKLNLKSDGHGGWLDSRGKFVATTEDGKLKFVSKKKAKAEEEKRKNTSKTRTNTYSKNQKQNQKNNQKQKRVNQRVAMAEKK